LLAVVVAEVTKALMMAVLAVAVLVDFYLGLHR
jgi:ABC-type antimicrobial peptide transport system permease subunit